VRHIVICDLSGCTIFFTLSHKWQDLKKIYIEHKMCILIFDLHRAVHRNTSLVEPTRCTNVSNLFYFGITLHVSDGLSIHHQEFETVHTTTVICQTVNPEMSTQLWIYSLTDGCCCMYSLELLTIDGKTV